MRPNTMRARPSLFVRWFTTFSAVIALLGAMLAAASVAAAIGITIFLGSVLASFELVKLASKLIGFS